MCPLRRALTMLGRVQRMAAEGQARRREVAWDWDHSPKVTLVEPGRWVAVVDGGGRSRGVVVCDEWGLVVASANIGEARVLPHAPSTSTFQSSNRHPLGVCRDPVLVYILFYLFR